MRYFVLGSALLSLFTSSALAATPTSMGDYVEDTSSPPTQYVEEQSVTQTTTVRQAPPARTSPRTFREPPPAPPEMIRTAHGVQAMAEAVFKGHQPDEYPGLCSEQRNPDVWYVVDYRTPYCLWTKRAPPTSIATRTYAEVEERPAQPTREEQHRQDRSCDSVPHDVSDVQVHKLADGGVEVCSRRANPSVGQMLLGGLLFGTAVALDNRYGYGYRGYNRAGQAFYTRGPCSMPPGYTGPIVPCR